MESLTLDELARAIQLTVKQVAEKVPTLAASHLN